MALAAKDVNEAQRLLEKLKSSYPEVSKLFHEWKTQRQKSINCIGDLQKKLDNIEYGCNIAHSAGGAMEIVGGVAMVVGGLLQLFGHESAGKVLKSGATCNVAGTMTSVSSTVAEAGLTYKVINEVKTVLREDEELTKPLMEYLEYSRKIDSYLKNIFNCGLLSDVLPSVLQLCLQCFRLLKDGSYEISQMISDLKSERLKCIDISDYTKAAIQNVGFTLRNLYFNPSIRQSLLNICNIVQANPLTFKLVKVSLKISVELCDSVKINLVSTAIKSSSLLLSNMTVAKCILNTALVAVDIITIATVITKKQEEKSKNSKRLSDLKLALVMELNAVNVIFSEKFEKR